MAGPDDPNDDLHGYPYQDEYEDITDAAQIAGLLRRVQEHHVLLTVALNEAQDPPLYNSAVVTVEPERAEVLIDALHPPSGHRQVQPGRRLQAFARLHGIEMSFALDIEGLRPSEAAYLARLPRLLHYRQRRQQYRVQVGHGSAVSVELVLRDQTRCSAELVDISAGGVCLRCSRDALAGAEPGTVLPGMELRLPGRQLLECALEVRNIRREASTEALVGARFIGLDRRLAQQVQRFVAAMDRDARKRDLRVR